MGWRDRVKLAGKLTKRFRVWRIDVYGKPYACEGNYDTAQGLNAHRWRSDWDYKIQVGRRFMTRREFGDWAKNNSHVVTRDMDKTRLIDLYQDNRTSLKAYCDGAHPI
jgi:hypothetical protein